MSTTTTVATRPVHGWSIALALATVTSLPLQVAAEVQTVTGTAWRGPHVRLGVRDPASYTPAGDAALLLRWWALLPASTVLLVDLGYGGQEPLWDARIRAMVDGVDVTAARMLQITPAHVERLQERPEAGYAVLVEIATSRPVQLAGAA